jgi:hypothetical protein
VVAANSPLQLSMNFDPGRSSIVGLGHHVDRLKTSSINKTRNSQPSKTSLLSKNIVAYHHFVVIQEIFSQFWYSPIRVCGRIFALACQFLRC